MKHSHNHFSTLKVVTAALLISLGAVSRYLLRDIPNVETITVVTLLAGSLLGGPWTFTVGLLTIGITDIAIGNTNILLYTWSAWALMGVLGWFLRNRSKKPLRHSLELTGMGFIGNLFFFLFTNFGVWHLSGLYPHTANGLVMSYIAGLPFLKMQLLGTAIIVPIVSVIALTAWKYATARQVAHTAQTQKQHVNV